MKPYRPRVIVRVMKIKRPGTGRLIRSPLARRQSGIESFWIEGRVHARRVHARWDGRRVLACRVLWRHAQVTIAVDDAYAEAGFDARLPEAMKGSPEELLIALATSCDRIDLLEYERKGRRRVIAA